MPEIVTRVVDVYVYRTDLSEEPRFLLLRRAPGTIYAGQWRMVGGKIRDRERAWETGLRELAEETGLHPTTVWTVPSVNVFYEWQHDRVNLVPAFAAQVEADPVLDREHDAYRWLPAGKAVSHLAWPEQRRMISTIEQMLGREIPPELVLEPRVSGNRH